MVGKQNLRQMTGMNRKLKGIESGWHSQFVYYSLVHKHIHNNWAKLMLNTITVILFKSSRFYCKKHLASAFAKRGSRRCKCRRGVSRCRWN